MFVFLYSVAKALQKDEEKQDEESWRIPFFDFINIENGPGKIFALTNEGLFELLLRYENMYNGNFLELTGLAGERILKIENKTPLKWVEQLYKMERENEYTFG